MKPMPIQIRDAVRAELGLTLGGLMTWNGTYSFRARHILAAALHCAGLSQREAARFMRRDPSTIQHSCRWIAERVAEITIARKCVESLGFTFDIKRISVGFPSDGQNKESPPSLKEKSPSLHSPSKENTPTPAKKVPAAVAAAPRAKAGKAAKPKTWANLLIAAFCEEWPKAHKGQKYERNGLDAQRAEREARTRGGEFDDAWWRATFRRYFANREVYVVSPSCNHSLWWLLDKGLAQFGAAHKTVTVQEHLAKQDAEHAARRSEEKAGDHGFAMSLFGRGAFEQPSGDAEADRIRRERQVAEMKARGATS